MADAETLDIITHPERGDAQELLHRLGLDGIPSQEELRTEIEDELLIPRKDLVNNLLDESQMYVSLVRKHFVLIDHQPLGSVARCQGPIHARVESSDIQVGLQTRRSRRQGCWCRRGPSITSLERYMIDLTST